MFHSDSLFLTSFYALLVYGSASILTTLARPMVLRLLLLKKVLDAAALSIGPPVSAYFTTYYVEEAYYDTVSH